MVNSWSPSSISSSTPVMVTVCGVSQFSGLNTNSLTATVPSDSSLLTMLRVTFAVGSLSRTTVNSVVPPASVVSNPWRG